MVSKSQLIFVIKKQLSYCAVLLYVSFGLHAEPLMSQHSSLWQSLSDQHIEPAWPAVFIDNSLALATSSGLLFSQIDQPVRRLSTRNLFPAVKHDDSIYLTGSDGLIEKYPLDLLLGQQLASLGSDNNIAVDSSPNWRIQFDHWVFPPAVAGDQVIVTTRNNIHALNTKTGEILWRHAIESEPVFSPVFLPSNHIGVLTYGAQLRIYNREGKNVKNLNLPTIGKYLNVLNASELLVSGIDGRLLLINTVTEQITSIPAGRSVLTPLGAELSGEKWYMEGKTKLWRLNVFARQLSLFKVPENIGQAQFAVLENTKWTLLKNKSGTLTPLTMSTHVASQQMDF